MAMTFQMLMRGVDGKTSCLRFSSRTLLGSLLHERIAAILRIPAGAFLIVTGTRVINPHSFLCASSDGFFPSCSLLLRLRGGKGGFGSLLRGAATKAGQKKTSNFDACRDMSGRRLRHVNAEKKLKEWKTQAKERELEKTANEFLKKQVKQKEDESGCSQVIERFREETFRAREDVESAVAQGLAEAKKLGKRKILDDCQPSTSSKRANIFDIDTDEEDSEDEREGFEDEDEDTDSDGSEVEDAEGSEDEDIEKGSEHENHKQSSEDDKAEQGSEVARVEGKFLDENAKVTSEDEQGKGGSECERDEETIKENHLCNGLDDGHVEKNMSIVEVTCSSMSVSVDVEFQKQHSYSCEERTEQGSNALPTRGENTCTKNGFHSESTNTASVNVETKDFLTVQATLNLGDYLHASDLEVLGLERLKQELQIRGLKCGGSLAERAGRLFLLKTVPLERLDKKHFAKARV